MVGNSPIWRSSLQSIGSMRWWSASALVMALVSALFAGSVGSAPYAEGPEPHSGERTAHYSLKKAGPMTPESCAR